VSAYEAAVLTDDTGPGEHCHANPSDLAGIGRDVGDQVRIVRSAREVALYTVRRPVLATPNHVAMGQAGRRRLHGPDLFDVVVHAQVVDPLRTDEEAEAVGEFVERIVVGTARQVAVVAPHGGDIEAHTDEQAYLMRRKLRTFGAWAWVCKGWANGGGAFARWHITSTDLSPGSFPLLARMLRTPFAHAVSFHGFNKARFPGADVRIGGLADPALKAKVRDAIEQRVNATGRRLSVVVAGPGDPFKGTDPDNIVNRLSPTSGGLQIEQSASARELAASDIAHAVVEVYGSVLVVRPPSPHTRKAVRDALRHQ
jgi:phage replication-related protein YjqB (UPF0714/DUF867 family)